MAATQVLVEMGERLRRQRKKMKMTQEETAELLEISTTFYGGNRKRQQKAFHRKNIACIQKNGFRSYISFDRRDYFE